MASKARRPAKRTKRTTTPQQPTPVPHEREMKQAIAHMQKLLAQLDDVPEPSEKWHRKPTLTDDEWREAVNKQLDALTSYGHLHGIQLHISGLQALQLTGALDIMKDTLKGLVETSRMMATGLHTIMRGLSVLDHHTKASTPDRGTKETAMAKQAESPAKKSTVDYDKLLSRLLVVGRIIETVGTVFGYTKPPHQ